MCLEWIHQWHTNIVVVFYLSATFERRQTFMRIVQHIILTKAAVLVALSYSLGEREMIE
jgi:hypothetical protein